MAAADADQGQLGRMRHIEVESVLLVGVIVAGAVAIQLRFAPHSRPKPQRFRRLMK
jgi:hypothetical protein